MMRGRKTMVTAVRRPDGNLAFDTKNLSGIFTGPLRRIPLLRGIVVLLEAMVLGVRSLMYSANIALEEEGEEISRKYILLMIGAAIALVVVLFVLAPLFITRMANPLFPNSLVFHIVEGVIRLGIFVAYLKLVSLLPDIKRTFSYHGAEHKTVNAYEAGVPLEVEAVQRHSTAHVRCGTSFLFVVLLIAIIVFAFVGRQEPWLMVITRVLLLPVIAGLSYEVTHFGGKHAHNPLVRAVLSPGLFLQKLTTNEPDDSQVEVAVAALQKVIDAENPAPAGS